MAEKDMLNDPMILRELIMDHYQFPHNHGLKKEDSAYDNRHMASDSCIDDITVQAKIVDGRIEDIRFDGMACTISTASTSMMTDLLKGKTVEEAKKIIAEYFAMIDEAVAMKNVNKQANRIKCATIGWKAIKEMLEEGKAKK